MSSQRPLFDAPVGSPSDDLLDMAPYARKLVDFILTVEPPFTIGVYGEWGEGKTSFVRLVEHYLRRAALPAAVSEVLFVTFTAWPYKSSDELWRALVIEIARCLYREEAKAAEQGSTVAAPQGLRQRLGRFLQREALIWHSPSQDERQQEYRTLLETLDSTRPRTEGQAPEDQGEALLVFARVAAAALSPLSPLVAGLRGLLGSEAKLGVGELLHRETRRQIESIRDFQQVFSKLFNKRAKGKCVCIFIDDLDRVMPDAALELLEAVKIFFEGVPATFIVAGDEHLIGQGLRLRFRELLKEEEGGEGETFLDQKGREYFEKIIQLGIRVPRRKPEQTRRLLATQFPEWLSATDLLRLTVGDNPRRLKQYCNWLRYKYLVTHPPKDRLLDRFAVLGKIVSLGVHSPPCLEFLRLIAEHPDTFQQDAAWIERSVAEPDRKSTADPEPVPSAAAHNLYELATSCEPILGLLKASPHLSQCSASEVAAFSRIADLTSDPEKIVQTRDPCFLRILELVAHKGVVTPEQLLQRSFERLVAIRRRSLPVLERLCEAAAGKRWLEQMLLLEAALDGGLAPTQAEGDGTVAAILAEVAKAGIPEDPTGGLRRLLCENPRLSSLLPDEVFEFCSLPRLPEPAELISDQLIDSVAEWEADRKVAAWAVENLPPASAAKMRESYAALIEAAQILVRARGFVKLDAFHYCWPALAQRLQTDLRGLTAQEARLLEPQPAAEESEPWWEDYQDDERLSAFLKLRPLIRDVDEFELKSYFTEVEATKGSSAERKQPKRPSDTLPPVEVRPLEYENVLLRFSRAGEDAGKDTYDISLQRASSQGEATFQAELLLSDISRTIHELFSVRAAPEASQSVPREMRIEKPFDLKMRELGELISTKVFQGAVRDTLNGLLNERVNFRLLCDLNDVPELVNLPLEALYLAEPWRVFAALARRYSIVRYTSAPEAQLQLRAFSPPLRILALIPQPSDMPPLPQSAEEESVLRQALEVAVKAGRVQIEVLARQEATRANLQERLRRFRPHVFHFSGHGVARPEKGSGLVFSKEDGTAFLIGAADVANLLRGGQVMMTVLNGCDTGAVPTNDALSGLAAALIAAGVPAVVGTMREIADEAGLMFAREFYRTLAAGYPLELAVIEARIALCVERWDWSAYALFSGLDDLGSLRLVTDATRSE